MPVGFIRSFQEATRASGLRPVGPAVLNVKTQYQSESALAEEGVMEELADATGGRYFHNNNDLKAGFGQVAAAPEFVYVLGFSPQNLKLDGTYHALKVKLTNSRGLDLQARRGYYAPKHLADPEEDAKREIQEALFSRDELQDIPVELHMQFFKSSDVAAKIAVLARVNLKSLRFRKADGRNNDNLTVLSGVFDRNGNYISAMQKTVEMRLLDPTLEKAVEFRNYGKDQLRRGAGKLCHPAGGAGFRRTDHGGAQRRRRDSLME